MEKIENVELYLFVVYKGGSSYHLWVPYFSQFSFDSEMHTISAAVLKQLLIMFVYISKSKENWKKYLTQR